MYKFAVINTIKCKLVNTPNFPFEARLHDILRIACVRTWTDYTYNLRKGLQHRVMMLVNPASYGSNSTHAPNTMYTICCTNTCSCSMFAVWAATKTSSLQHRLGLYMNFTIICILCILYRLTCCPRINPTPQGSMSDVESDPWLGPAS